MLSAKEDNYPGINTNMSLYSNTGFKNSSRKGQTTRAKLDFSKKTGSNLKKSQIIVEE